MRHQMADMPFSTDSLLVKKERKRIQNQRSRGQEIGSALAATTTSPGEKRAMPVIKRSHSAKLSKTVGRKSWTASKKTELEEEEQKEGCRRI